MSNISTKRQRELIEQLAELVAYRAARELEIERVYDTKTNETREKTAAEIQRLTDQHNQQQDALNSKYIARLETAVASTKTIRLECTRSVISG